MRSVEDRYFDGAYLEKNPSWDSEDAPWKAAKVVDLLRRAGVKPTSICDVGCGSGGVLAHLHRLLPSVALTGFDVSPQLEQFWSKHSNIRFSRGNFHETNSEVFDVLLMLDVFEHVRDPFTFLESSRRHARQFVFHIPLDLSALSVARGAPLMSVRREVGHLHFYTKDLALETLQECGYSIDEWCYTGAYARLGTHSSLKTRLALLPRKIASAFDKDFGVRLFGGETLLVLARGAEQPRQA
jgi:SAM-dependent methyltransferase